MTENNRSNHCRTNPPTASNSPRAGAIAMCGIQTYCPELVEGTACASARYVCIMSKKAGHAVCGWNAFRRCAGEPTHHREIVGAKLPRLPVLHRAPAFVPRPDRRAHRMCQQLEQGAPGAAVFCHARKGNHLTVEKGKPLGRPACARPGVEARAGRRLVAQRSGHGVVRGSFAGATSGAGNARRSPAASSCPLQ